MTKQQYYNKLVKAATNGTFPGYEDGNGCRYRTPAGKQCAVGILFKKDAYAIHHERQSLSSLALAGVLEPVEGLDENQLADIQQLHDNHAKTSWQTSRFIKDLNTLACFADVIKETA